MSDYENTAANGVNAEEKQWGMFAHLASLAGIIIPWATCWGR